MDDTANKGMERPLVALRSIGKSFGPVRVLDSVDLTVAPGEVHVLAGENGAGKSTLIRILSGVYPDFDGSIEMEGRARRFLRPADAWAAGIATIHQELSIVPSMSVADNLALGREPAGRLGWLDRRARDIEAAEALFGLGLDLDLRATAGALPVSTRQMVEIARALSRDARVLILDEPTSALSEPEAERLFTRIAELRSRGRGIVYITHRMEEIYRLADRITVLRDGRLVVTARASELGPDALVRAMVGRDVGTRGRSAPPTGRRDPVLLVRELRVAHQTLPGRPVVDGLSFRVSPGEIVGLAGLHGSGASEVLHAVAGTLGRRVSGSISVGGEPWAPASPGRAIRRGVVLLPNDRKALGLAMDRSVRDSASLSALGRFTGRLGWVRRGDERTAVREATGEVRLSAPSLDAPVASLSGGNQQKVLLARCLMARPRVLLLDEPTRGIDVAAKSDVYALVRRLVADGLAILLITSELDELIALSDRILVLHSGRLAAEMRGGEGGRERILAAAMGHGVAA